MKIIFINRIMGIHSGVVESYDLNFAKELTNIGGDVIFIIGKKLYNSLLNIAGLRVYLYFIKEFEWK